MKLKKNLYFNTKQARICLIGSAEVSQVEMMSHGYNPDTHAVYEFPPTITGCTNYCTAFLHNLTRMEIQFVFILLPICYIMELFLMFPFVWYVDTRILLLTIYLNITTKQRSVVAQGHEVWLYNGLVVDSIPTRGNEIFI